MKQSKLLMAVSVLFFLAQAGFGQILNSAHDFHTQSWAVNNEICNVCHTPHNAIPSNDAPLWNHELSGVLNYTLYTSPTLNAVVGQPDGSSKLCLSCHDGTVALENFGGMTGGTNFITGDALLGTDISNDHPVSFTYNTALATTDGGLYDPSTHPSGITPAGTIATDMLFSGKMQCASCHDVHNGYGVANLLVKDNAISALCLTCHDK